MILMIVMVAGSAMAESKVYGRVHASLDMQDNGAESAFVLNSNSSRIGWKGYTELNENFTAIWKFETAYDLNDSDRTWSARDTYAGVKSQWGKLKAGHFDTPMKQLGSATTFFMDQVGDRRQMTLGKDMRYHSQVSYSLPHMDNGFGASVSTVLSQNENDWYATDVESETAFYIAADYSGEAFMIGVAVDNHSAGNFGEADDDPVPESETTIRVAGNYSGDAFGVNVMYQTTSNFMGIDGMSATVFGLEALFKASDSFHIKAGYTMTDPNTDGDDDGASLIVFGVDHPISDDVTFYIQYAMIQNDDLMAAGLNGSLNNGGGWGGSIEPAMTGTAPDLSAENPSDISLGMMIDF